jgi:hypothetical protein
MLGLGVRVALGQVSLPEPLELDRFRTRRARFLNGVSGQLEKDLTREGVVLRVQRIKLEANLAQIAAGRDPQQRDPNRRDPILSGGHLPRRHNLDPRPLPPPTFGAHVLLAIAYSKRVADLADLARGSIAGICAPVRAVTTRRSLWHPVLVRKQEHHAYGDRVPRCEEQGPLARVQHP